MVKFRESVTEYGCGLIGLLIGAIVLGVGLKIGWTLLG